MKRMQYNDLPKRVQRELERMEAPGQDPEDCIETLRQIMRKYPGYIPARLNLAAMQLEAGEVLSAQKTYQAVLKDYPGESGAIAGLATVAAANKDFEKADSLAQEALDKGYLWPPLYEVIGEAREAAGDTKAAAAAYLQSYRLSPHSWNDLERYCRLTHRRYISPMDEVPQPMTHDQLKALFKYIDEALNAPDKEGNKTGCDHTFRFTEKWAEKNALDVIELYQFLNALGGFCDCEVCYNVESSLFEGCEDEDDD